MDDDQADETEDDAAETAELRQQLRQAKETKRDRLVARDPVEWARAHMRTERGGRLDFDRHPYMILPLTDRHARKGLMCASQVGKTMIAMCDVLHFCDTHEVRVIFTMHTDSECQKFSATRAKPAIEASPYLRERIGGIDSVETKTFRGAHGTSVIFFKGARADSQALSEPADMIVHDELDYSRPDTLALYQDRTAASAHDRKLVVGTPTLPKFGLSALWEDSSQTEWLVRCPACGDERPLSWPESFALDIAEPYYKCAHGHELTRQVIQEGRWADARTGDYTWRMYHIPRMLRPNWPADRFAAEFERRRAEFPELAINQMLGLAATSGETELDQATIAKAIVDVPPATRWEADTFAGCDQSSAPGQHRVLIGRRQGDGRYVYIRIEICDWDRLAELMDRFNVRLLVIDAQPETTMAQKLAADVPGRVLLAWYPNMPIKSNQPMTVDWKRARIDLDRTATLDQSARRLRQRSDLFCSMPLRLRKTFVSEMSSLVRGLDLDKHGQAKGFWRETGADHFRHAHNYSTVAGLLLQPYDDGRVGVASTVDVDAEPARSLREVIAEEAIAWEDAQLTKRFGHETGGRITEERVTLPSEELSGDGDDEAKGNGKRRTSDSPWVR